MEEKMKKTRIAAIVMAILMLGASMISCAGGASKEVKCTLSVVVDGEYLVDSLEVPTKGSGDADPVVLDALKIALDYLGVNYELGSTNLKRVMFDGKEYAEGRDAEGKNHWFWVYTCNGVEPENGSAAVNAVNEGDYIEFIYTSIPVEEEVETTDETEETDETSEDGETEEDAGTEEEGTEDEAEG